MTIPATAARVPHPSRGEGWDVRRSHRHVFAVPVGAWGFSPTKPRSKTHGALAPAHSHAN
jgi:hypothetical protein